MLLIELYGGPGVGKSTLSAGVFAYLKEMGVNAEMVREYAKELVWQGRDDLLQNQMHVSSTQFERERVLYGKVDVLVTDSPIDLGLIYSPEDQLEAVHHLLATADTLRDMHGIACHKLIIPRKKVYNPKGRNQTEEEAKEIDGKILEMLYRRTGQESFPYAYDSSMETAKYVSEYLIRLYDLKRTTKDVAPKP